MQKCSGIGLRDSDHFRSKKNCRGWTQGRSSFLCVCNDVGELCGCLGTFLDSFLREICYNLNSELAIINHPPITIFMVAINHQKWVVYDVTIPTLIQINGSAFIWRIQQSLTGIDAAIQDLW